MVDVRTYTRDGCRGGQEQFKWDNLKEQDFKDREQYLGASTKVGLMAKFGRYHVHDWYARKRDTAENIEDERKTIQQFEEELMQEALGLKPKKLLLAKKQLSEEELKEFLKRDSEKRPGEQGREMMGPQKKTVTDNDGAEVDAQILYADAPQKGLGFAAHRSAKLEKYKSDILGTESKLEGLKSEPIKLEVKTEIKNELMSDTETIRFGMGQASSSSSSGLKKEEKPDIVSELKAEVKDEKLADASGSKRLREDDIDEERDHRKPEKQKKERSRSEKAKKQKKAEKKAKKKVKKAAKKAKKAAKLAAKSAARRATASNSSASSASSSS